MNKQPNLIGTYAVRPCNELLLETSSLLLVKYGGAICNGCLQLLAEEWGDRDSKPMTMQIFSEFEDTFNVHKFAQGFNLEDKPRFRQATIVELLALGTQERNLGLDGFVYCLGSAQINPKERLACGMVDPTVFYPGLESMDGSRQMLLRAICNPWSRDTRVALVKL